MDRMPALAPRQQGNSIGSILFTDVAASAHVRKWHDTDYLADATTLVGNLGVNCRAGTPDFSELPFFVPSLKRAISITPIS